jgi:formylglycine-generating enzyme required for sulfatase activity
MPEVRTPQRLLLLALLATATVEAAEPVVTDQVEGTQHEVESVLLPGGEWYMTRTEISWDLFDSYRFDDIEGDDADAVTGPTKPYLLPNEGFGHSGYPAMAMTQKNAEMFAAWLSQRTGQSYRLPTEAEWEAACQAGIAEGLEPVSDYAWNWDNANDITGPVGEKKPDQAGLHDMLGNVAELVVAEDGKPTVRGGSFRTDAADLECSWRKTYTPAWNATDPQFPKSEWWYSDGPFIGFRLVREVN